MCDHIARFSERRGTRKGERKTLFPTMSSDICSDETPGGPSPRLRPALRDYSEQAQFPVPSSLLLLLLLLSAGVSLAQQNSIDQERRDLDRLAQSDTNRMIALVKLAQRCIREDPRKAPALLEEAEKTATRFDKKKMLAFAKLVYGKYYMAIGVYDSSRLYLEQAEMIYRALKWGLGLANCLYANAEMCWKKGKTAEALDYAKNSLAMYESLGNVMWTAYASNLIGTQFFERGMLDSAAVYFERCLRAHERIGHRLGMANALHNLGNVQTDKAKSLEFYRKALALDEETGDSSSMVASLLHIAQFEWNLGRYHEARAMVTRAMRIAEEMQDHQNVIFAHFVLGRVAASLNECGVARKEYLDALKVSEKSGVDKPLPNVLIELGRLFMSCINDLDTAIGCGKRALAIAERRGDAENIRIAGVFLSDAYAASGQYDIALMHYREAAAINDRIYNEKSAKTVAELTARYEADKRESAIRALEQEGRLREAELLRRSAEAAHARQRAALLAREKEIGDLELRNTSYLLESRRREITDKRRELARLEKNRRLQAEAFERERALRNTTVGGLAAALLAVFLSFMLVWRRLREKKRAEGLRAEAAELRARAAEAQSLAVLAETERREKEAQKEFSRKLLESQEQERKRVAGELHDGLGQELLVIGNQANLALLDEHGPAARAQFEKIAAMTREALDDVRVISRNLRPLLLERAGLGKTLRDIVLQAEQSSSVRFTADIGDLDGLFAGGEQINVFRIVQEALNNVLKHSGATEASVGAHREGAYLRLTISDNGRGFDLDSLRDEGPHRLGFGLQSMGERARLLGGTIKIRSNPGAGTEIEVRLPVTETPQKDESEGRPAVA